MGLQGFHRLRGAWAESYTKIPEGCSEPSLGDNDARSFILGEDAGLKPGGTFKAGKTRTLDTEACGTRLLGHGYPPFGRPYSEMLRTATTANVRLDRRAKIDITLAKDRTPQLASSIIASEPLAGHRRCCRCRCCVRAIR